MKTEGGTEVPQAQPHASCALHVHQHVLTAVSAPTSSHRARRTRMRWWPTV